MTSTEEDIAFIKHHLACEEKYEDRPSREILYALLRIESAIYNLRHELEMAEDADVAMSDSLGALADE